jgi:hypothetical protein
LLSRCDAPVIVPADQPLQAFTTRTSSAHKKTPAEEAGAEEVRGMEVRSSES